jgi:hypothetical protein
LLSCIEKLPLNSSVTLVDIGAAGEIQQRWNEINSVINYVGFEPDSRSRELLLVTPPSCKSYRIYPDVVSDDSEIMNFNLTRKPEVSSIYEPNFDVNQLLDVDVQAILIFLRNSAFGSEYNVELVDPSNGQKFTIEYNFDSLTYEEPIHNPNENGLYTFTTKISNKNLKLKLLNLGDQRELEKLQDQYPKNLTAPIVTKKLEKHIVELDGETSKIEISKFVK